MTGLYFAFASAISLTGVAALDPHNWFSFYKVNMMVSKFSRDNTRMPKAQLVQQLSVELECLP